MLMRLPTAAIRTQVELPLRFADARVFSFEGLVDGRVETKARRGRHTLELPSVLRSHSSESPLVEPGAAALP